MFTIFYIFMIFVCSLIVYTLLSFDRNLYANERKIKFDIYYAAYHNDPNVIIVGSICSILISVMWPIVLGMILLVCIVVSIMYVISTPYSKFINYINSLNITFSKKGE